MNKIERVSGEAVTAVAMVDTVDSGQNVDEGHRRLAQEEG